MVITDTLDIKTRKEEILYEEETVRYGIDKVSFINKEMLYRCLLPSNDGDASN